VVAAPGLTPPTSVRQAAGGLEIIEVDDTKAATVRALADCAGHEGSVGVIVADAALAAIAEALRLKGIEHTILGADEPHQGSDQHSDRLGDQGGDARGEPAAERRAAATTSVALVPASLAKGLEYDRVIVVEPADIAAAEYDEVLGLRRLYVVLTRAVTRLTVLHALALPALLSD
jgi:hypothetical protein